MSAKLTPEREATRNKSCPVCFGPTGRPVKANKMRWYKHDSQDRYSVASKLIRSKFGAEGYGIFQALIEVVAENVGKDPKVWGMVDERYITETLAIECATTPERLTEFFQFCDKHRIFSKKRGILYFPEIMNRLDNWTYDKIGKLKKDYQVTSKQLPSHFGKKEKEKEKEKGLGSFKYNPQKTAELVSKAYALIGNKK